MFEKGDRVEVISGVYKGQKLFFLRRSKFLENHVILEFQDEYGTEVAVHASRLEAA